MPRLKLKYYALLRELAGVELEEVDVDKCEIPFSEILEILGKRDRVRELVRLGYVLLVHGGSLITSREAILNICDDPRVDVVPPSAGGVSQAKLVLGKQIPVADFLRELLGYLDSESGAIATYFGVVKGSLGGKRVEKLVYEYHERATEEALSRIAEEVASRAQLKAVLIYHSVGEFKPGDVVFAVGVVGRGRREVVEALREVVERVKHETAIWKKEFRDDGVYWVVGDGTRVPIR
jgi:molybdopterin synthase catalytic subunit